MVRELMSVIKLTQMPDSVLSFKLGVFLTSRLFQLTIDFTVVVDL